jgi:transposase-like protein
VKEREPTAFEIIQAKFETDDACRDYMFKQRWPGGFICPLCGCREYYLIKKRHKYQCKNCRYQASVTEGTVMDRSHLPLTIWVWAIFLVAHDKRGISATQLSRVLNLPYNTSWFLLHRIRHAMAERDSLYKLAGIVELDDTFFGAPRKGGKRGRGTTKTKVIVALSKDEKGSPQFAKMQVVPDLKGTTIGKFANERIKMGSEVHTDAYQAYRKPLSAKYWHKYAVFDADTNMLKWLHTVIGNSKSFVLGTFHGLGKKHLQRYLDEYCYRFNRRHKKDEIFDRLLFAVTQSTSLRFSDLIA